MNESKSLFNEFAEDCEKIYKILEEELKRIYQTMNLKIEFSKTVVNFMKRL